MAKKKGSKKQKTPKKKKKTPNAQAVIPPWSGTQSGWSGPVFSFEGPDNGEILKGEPNQFKLVPTLTKNGFHLMFRLESVPDSSGLHGVTKLWKDVSFVWIPGAPFTMSFNAHTPPPPEADERDNRYQETKKRFEKPEDRILYERLVGTTKTGLNRDATLTLFLATKNFTDGVKAIILGRADFEGASPGNAAVGNG